MNQTSQSQEWIPFSTLLRCTIAKEPSNRDKSQSFFNFLFQESVFCRFPWIFPTLGLPAINSFEQIRDGRRVLIAIVRGNSIPGQTTLLLRGFLSRIGVIIQILQCSRPKRLEAPTSTLSARAGITLDDPMRTLQTMDNKKRSGFYVLVSVWWRGRKIRLGRKTREMNI